jgi:hypothetical protein
MAGMHHTPDGPAFDVVLLLHVGCVVVGLATTAASATTAARLRGLLGSAAPFPDAVVRYFRPGVNWAGRAVFGIPVFGFALLGLSQGAYALHDTWVQTGLAIFVVLAFVTEGSLWPVERRLQRTLPPLFPGGGAPDAAVRRDARVMELSAAATIVLLVTGSVLMLVQP